VTTRRWVGHTNGWKTANATRVLHESIVVLEPVSVATRRRTGCVAASVGWTGPPSPGRIAAVKYKSRRPRWIRIVVGLVVVFIVLAVVGAAIGR